MRKQRSLLFVHFCYAAATALASAFAPPALAAGPAAQLGYSANGPGAQGGSALVWPMPSATVGLLEVEFPQAESFVLRGTLPVPPKTFPGSSPLKHLGVVDRDGTVVPAQIEVVSRYAKAADGPDVIEVIARVRRPVNAFPGESRRYPVVWMPSAPNPMNPPSNTLHALADSPLDIPVAIKNLIKNPEGLRIEAWDAFGHQYRLDLFGTATTRTLMKHGPYRVETRVSGTMVPVAPVSGGSGTLPHFFGVHAYLGTYAGESAITLDLRLHNGHDGRDAGDPTDDALAKLYFSRIELNLPEGMHVLEAFDAPLTGATKFTAGRLAWSLVEPLPANKLHVIGQQGQFHRRLAIAPYGALSPAVEILERKGIGFARRGKSPMGNRLWSWWNPLTARWFPQNFVLPHLEHVGMEALRDKLRSDLAWTQGHYEAGTGLGNYPIQENRMGWAHPWGIAYGGMTGGTEINLFDGIREMESASRHGLRHTELIHMMQTDRQSTALYSLSGRPTRLEDWLVPGSTPYLPFSFYMKLHGTQDPFGSKSAPLFQVQAVAAANRQPDYEDTLLAYQPHDLQHLIRYTRSAKVLSWALNDSLAKDDLLMQAELVRLSYHRYPNNPNGYTDPTGLLFDLNHVNSWPGRGSDFGRGEAWGTDTVTAAFALAAPSWRETSYAWFKDLAYVVAGSVVPCNGHILARQSNKMLEGKYRGAQSFEDSIVHNALEGVVETVFRGHDAAFSSLLDDTLLLTYWAFVGPLQWNHTLKGPKDIYAIGPPDVAQGIWCSVALQPADGFVPTINTFQTYSSLGYAFALTGHNLFVQRATEMLGPEPLAKLYGIGASNIENRAALLAAAQSLLGEL